MRLPSAAIVSVVSLASIFKPAHVGRKACVYASDIDKTHCETSPGPVTQLVRLQCPKKADAMILSEMLLDAGAMFVSLSDANAGSDEEVPLFAVHHPDAPGDEMILSQEATEVYDDPHRIETWNELLSARRLWSSAALEVGFSEDADVEATLLLCAATAEVELPRFTIESLGKRDWVREVQANWPPVLLPDCLIIRFPWHSEECVAALSDNLPSTSITLHPGMAFGTGEHVTTQLCCKALMGLDLSGATVLDYGSGSGVLSFAALHFGAERAIGVEIDSEALVISRMNAAENGLDSRFEALLPEEEGSLQAAYPVVVANILAGTLIQLQSLLTKRVEEGGNLIISGIWGEQQANKVIAAYKGAINFSPPIIQDGWILLQGKRVAAPAD